MKSFKSFIVSEEVDLTANVERGVMDVHDHAVRNNINAFLNGELGCNVVTPYVALNKVNKVLANFHIFLPKAPYMEDDQGVHVFNIKQFNRVAGMRDDGSVVTKVEQPYHLYFEWKRNERGMFDVFAEIVTDEELADLIKAVEEDVSGEGDLYEETINEEGIPRSPRHLTQQLDKMYGPGKGTYIDPDKNTITHLTIHTGSMRGHDGEAFETREHELIGDGPWKHRKLGKLIKHRKPPKGFKIDEEAEQLDELKATTLRSYRRKAEGQLSQGKAKGKDYERQLGIDRANNRLKKRSFGNMKDMDIDPEHLEWHKSKPYYFGEGEEKEIKKAYKAAAKDPNDDKVGKHLKFAAKIVKKKLSKGEKIDEQDADFIGNMGKIIGYDVDRQIPKKENPKDGQPGDINQGMKGLIKPPFSTPHPKKKNDPTKNQLDPNQSAPNQGYPGIHYVNEAKQAAAEILKKKVTNESVTFQGPLLAAQQLTVQSKVLKEHGKGYGHSEMPDFDPKDVVSLKTQSGIEYKVHKKYAPQFQGFVKDMEDSGYKIKQIGGWRSGDPKAHGYAGAIDINWDDNPPTYKNTKNYGSHKMPDLVTKQAIYKKWGLGWGQNWEKNAFKDPHHFSVRSSEGGNPNWKPPEQTQSEPSTTPQQKVSEPPSVSKDIVAKDVPTQTVKSVAAPKAITPQKMPDQTVKAKEVTPPAAPKATEIKPIQPKIVQPKPIQPKQDDSTGALIQKKLAGIMEELRRKKKVLGLKTSNAKVLQKDLASAKTEITQLKRKLKDCDLDEQESGFLAHVSRQYIDKFPDVKKNPEQAAQYYRERTRKAETARHYNSDQYITGKKEEPDKPKG